MNNNCFYEEGCSLPSSDNELAIAQLRRELETLSNDTEYKLLLHDGKIAELYVYIKENLSKELRTLLDSMLLSGELNTLITNTITELGPIVDKLRCVVSNMLSQMKFYLPNGKDYH